MPAPERNFDYGLRGFGETAGPRQAPSVAQPDGDGAVGTDAERGRRRRNTGEHDHDGEAEPMRFVRGEPREGDR